MDLNELIARIRLLNLDDLRTILQRLHNKYPLSYDIFAEYVEDQCVKRKLTPPDV